MDQSMDGPTNGPTDRPTEDLKALFSKVVMCSRLRVLKNLFTSPSTKLYI